MLTKRGNANRRSPFSFRDLSNRQQDPLRKGGLTWAGTEVRRQTGYGVVVMV